MAIISFKCPNCDGELIFDPKTQKYKCEYCNSLFSQEELDAMNPASATETMGQDVNDAGQEQEATERAQRAEGSGEENAGGASSAGEAVHYSCPSCGAEIITDATTAATFCYYCHNPVVLSGRLSGEFLPNKIIPFEVTREAAEKGFLDYVGKKKFVPKAFFHKKQIETMTGVYFPYWLYDVELEGNMQAAAHNIRVWRTGDVEHTETKHYAIDRAGEVELSNLPENALKKANAKLAEGVLPYRFEKMKDFHMGYLSGFLAERRDIAREEVQGKLQAEMRKSAETLMRETIKGYSSVSVQNTNFHAKHENWVYVLLPVWTITYKGRDGKIYYYSMNGQTGEVCGELPIDHGKVAITSAITALVVLILGLIGGFFI